MAIVISIMMLEVKVPYGTEWSAILPLLRVLGSYAMNFIYVGIYWDNHHHLLQVTEKVIGRTFGGNLHLVLQIKRASPRNGAVPGRLPMFGSPHNLRTRCTTSLWMTVV